MLSQVFGERSLGLQGATRVQEAYVTSIHGTKFRVSCAHFTNGYLNSVENEHAISNPKINCVYFHRSRAFDTKDPNDRVEAAGLMLGLFRYQISGDAKIATLQAVVSN